MRNVNLSRLISALSGGTRLNLLHRLAVSALVALTLAALAPPAAQAASIVVTTLDDELITDGDCSLREAITAANTNAAVDACPAGSGFESDTITFSVSGTIVLGSMLPNIADPAGLTIDGGQTVTISGNNAVQVMTIDKCATLDLKNITIANGYTNTSANGAILSFGALTLTNTTVSNNTTTFCCGGGISSQGLLTVTDSTFSGNGPEAIRSGGSDTFPGEVNITNSTFSGNGSALFVSFDTARIVNSTFSNNAYRSAVVNDRATMTIARSTFTQNLSAKGGAINTWLGSLTITDSTFSGNRADAWTGSAGGAIFSTDTTLAIANSTFADNEAFFVGNTSIDSSGGAIAVYGGTVTVTNSTFSNNLATVFNYYGRSHAYGGAIHAFGGSGTVDITNSTFAGNHTRRHTELSVPWPEPNSGGTIKNDGMTVMLRNTLVAKYTTPSPWDAVPNCSGTMTDGGGNLSTDTTCPGLIADPLLDLAGLQDNGGPTDTIALLPGSPAIGAGVGAFCAAAPVNGLDQRDAPRAFCDIGAFEYGSTPPPVSPPDPLPPLPPQSGCAPVNHPPTVTNPGNQTSAEGTSVSLAISASDPDGDALTYSATGLPPGLSIGATTGLISGSLGYTATGTYAVTVTVTDTKGASASASFTWTVTDVNRPPVVTNPGDQTSAEGTSVSLQITASDPDGDAMTYSASGLPPGLSIGGTGLVSGSLGYSAAGTYAVTVTVTDAMGASASASFTWTVTDVNRPPAVTNPGNQTSAEGTTVTLQITASDPDGDSLTYSATGLPPGLSIDGTGLISGSLGYSAAGTYAVTVTVTDAKGASASASFTWTVTDVNRPPVLAPVGNKTVVGGTLLTFTLSASDPDGDVLTFGATGLPAGASLNASTGAFSWTPGAAQVGSYPVTFRVTDPGGLSASEMTTITVTAGTAENRDPICSPAWPSLSEIWPPNHRMVPISILGVTDPDGDPVTVRITAILQDEPTNTQGDGSTAVDGAGVGTTVAWVRAERTGTPRVPGNGRVYEIQFQATDGRGGTCAGAVMVGVPHDQGHGPAIDDGIRYDSTVASGPREREEHERERDRSHESDHETKGHEREHDRPHEDDHERSREGDRETSKRGES